MTIKDFFSFKRNSYFWLNLLAMVVVLFGVLFGVLQWLDHYTRHGEAVVVPDVKGMRVVQAEALFRNRGLSCQVVDSSYRKDLTPGCIIDYTPVAGQKVKEGRVIYLTINTLSIPPKQIPDVADNSSLRQAEARLLASGFKLAGIDTVRGEPDWVYGVKYEGRLLNRGEAVPTGAALVLVVGNGDGGGFPLLNDSLAIDSSAVKPATIMPEETKDDDSWF